MPTGCWLLLLSLLTVDNDMNVDMKCWPWTWRVIYASVRYVLTKQNPGLWIYDFMSLTEFQARVINLAIQLRISMARSIQHTAVVLAKILAKFFEHHMYKLVGSYERKHIFRIICVCLILAACLMHEFLHVTNAIAFYLRPKQMCESCLIQFLFTCDD